MAQSAYIALIANEMTAEGKSMLRIDMFEMVHVHQEFGAKN
jgi:hypothetical protein